ncbi:hypothetical protein NA78x_004622 [Anatilimnocola sp. NA78]|uniref:zinc ribbon domain-containing protein n=1 Tax=Anatilimnocola sp. NA78 TaxID=3415683 RepID=UPI003CE5C2D2
MTDDKTQRCPACGTALLPAAILCVNCGYHLKLGRHLATSVERAPEPALDKNPYASPAGVEATDDAPRDPQFDLTEAGARQAAAIVAESKSIFYALGAGCCFWPIFLLVIPWYGYRLYCWSQLNSRFAELRYPNGFSSHAELAVSFQKAKRWLYVGLSLSIFFSVVVTIMLVSRGLRELNSVPR